MRLPPTVRERTRLISVGHAFVAVAPSLAPAAGWKYGPMNEATHADAGQFRKITNEPIMKFLQNNPFTGYRDNLVLTALVEIDHLKRLSSSSMSLSKALSPSRSQRAFWISSISSPITRLVTWCRRFSPSRSRKSCKTCPSALTKLKKFSKDQSARLYRCS